MARKRTPVVGLLLLCALATLSACGQASAKLKPKLQPTATPALPKGWHVVASPRVGEEGNLADVTIISADDAWAVGSYVGVDALQRTLTERWDGASWSVVPSPNPSPVANELDAVSGTSANDVWAVGQAYSSTAPHYTPMPVIEHWDGKSWTVTPTPPLGHDENHLTGVAAISPTDAWIVGYTQGRDANGATQTPLLMRWNGSSWNTVAAPVAPGGNGGLAQLLAVTAIASNDVWAVGGNYASSPGPLIEHWDGARWTVAQIGALASLSGGESGSLVSVSADGPNDVWAVGSGVPDYSSGGCGFPGSRLMEHWDGQSWSTVSYPIPTSINGMDTFNFNRIAVAAHNDVWAVGGVVTSAVGTMSTISPVAEHWDGSQWSAVAQSFGPMINGFASVAAGSGVAWVVGQTQVSNGGGATVVGQWKGGQWAHVASPSPGTLSNALNGISVIGPKDIWAVGDSAAGSLSEHWDGAQWAVVPTVNVAPADNHLNAVAGTSANDIWAVGSAGGHYFGQGVAEHWDGSAWTSVSVPVVNGSPVQPLFGVATLKRNDAWAVGLDGAIHWNGSVWASAPGAPSDLLGVAAVSPNDVWAVGGNPPQSCGGIEPVTIAHWNGQRWSSMPNMPQGLLYSVSAVSGSDVWAVGFGVGGALIMHWDGKQWTQTTLSGEQSGILRCVFARASDDVWAVGQPDANQQEIMILHWNGHSWTPSSVKAPGLTTDNLNAVAADSAGVVWAVGSYSQWYGINQALIERYIP